MGGETAKEDEDSGFFVLAMDEVKKKKEKTQGSDPKHSTQHPSKQNT